MQFEARIPKAGALGRIPEEHYRERLDVFGLQRF
jgi:hypothetical protein